MRAIAQHQKKVIMWYKVTELNQKGFNKSQIARELGICRRTVRNYLQMNRDVFESFLSKNYHLPKKLDVYHVFVKELLVKYPFLSAAQVEDRLKENHSDFPLVNSKTIYNFTEFIRKKHNILKETIKDPRVYQKLPESNYGQFAQVDFGQTYMLWENNTRKKVHFMAMVLCRSRQKYIYFQSTSFTTNTAIVAHQKAFEYFQGQPASIIYDQDRVFIVQENMGDILLTQDFKKFVEASEFKTIFCRKADPESKGKIENVVKYVKNNFCKGRIYSTLEALNESAISWLERTANGKVHQGIKKTPQFEWIIEKEYLQEIKNNFVITQPELPKYKVRKDNTIHYKSNFYTLPLGTYKNSNSFVFLEKNTSKINLLDSNKSLLATHMTSIESGKTVRNTDHRRDKSQSLSTLKICLLEALNSTEQAKIFLDNLQNDKPRYARDNYLLIGKVTKQYSKDIVTKTLSHCLESNIYNAYQFEKTAEFYYKSTQNKIVSTLDSKELKKEIVKNLEDYTPKTSSINNYNKHF